MPNPPETRFIGPGGAEYIVTGTGNPPNGRITTMPGGTRVLLIRSIDDRPRYSWNGSLEPPTLLPPRTIWVVAGVAPPVAAITPAGYPSILPAASLVTAPPGAAIGAALGAALGAAGLVPAGGSGNAGGAPPPPLPPTP